MASTFRSLLALPIAATIGAPFATPTLAHIESTPSVDSICLHERVVFRPREGQSLADAGLDQRIELIRVTICDQSRRACMEQGEEVPMQLCR
jgi:hypothetical protein